jgi:hypothetical protein
MTYYTENALQMTSFVTEVASYLRIARLDVVVTDASPVGPQLTAPLGNDYFLCTGFDVNGDDQLIAWIERHEALDGEPIEVGAFEIDVDDLQASLMAAAWFATVIRGASSAFERGLERDWIATRQPVAVIAGYNG